jgi:hypothetical protein
MQEFAEAANRVISPGKGGDDHGGLAAGLGALAVEHGLGYLMEGVPGLGYAAGVAGGLGGMATLPYTAWAGPWINRTVPKFGRAAALWPSRALPAPAGGFVGQQQARGGIIGQSPARQPTGGVRGQ